MTPQAIIAAARRAGRRALGEADGKRLVAAYGVPVPRTVMVADAAFPESSIAALRPPLALKVVSPAILHKSDVGGVRLDIADAAGLRDAIAAMARIPAIRDTPRDGFLVEEMAPSGTELVIGAVRDPQFGPMIMVGLGGVLVEVLKDVAFRLCPIDRRDARAMLEDLRGAAILDGVRGRAKLDRDAIVETLVMLGGTDGLLMALADEIAELDLNPVIVGAHGLVAVDVRVILADAPGRAPHPGDDGLSPVERFAPLFEPKTVAVLGASTTSVAIANTFIRRMKSFGYKGEIYPIHPEAATIEGLPAYHSIAAAPQPIDYAYIAIGAARIPDLLAQAAGRLKFAQVISSGFGEVAEGRALEADLVAKARQGGCRVIGPNCLGVYSPRGGVTFSVDAPRELGGIGIVSQSGGLGTDIIKRGQWRGLRFSGLVTVGNSADVLPHDLIAYYLADPHTRVIGMYVEDIKHGRALFELLRRATKPIVILRGGRSALGRDAAKSHTGALAGDDRAWDALARQCVCVMVDTLDRFIDALLVLQCLAPRPARPTRQVVLFGNGGGTSVLATDYFAGVGLAVAPFAGELRARLEALRLPPGTSIANPIDTPVSTMQQEDGKVANRILDLVYQGSEPDAVVMHLNLAAFVGRGSVDPVDNLIAAALDVQTRHPGRAHFVLVLRSDGSPELDDRKRAYAERARLAAIPVYDELAPAADALAALRHVEERLAARAAS